MTFDRPLVAPPDSRAARREEAEDFVRLLRQIERQPELRHRLLRALERLRNQHDPGLCLELARRHSRRPVRSRDAALRWGRGLQALLLVTRLKPPGVSAPRPS